MLYECRIFQVSPYRMSLTAAVQCHEHNECDQHTVKTSQEIAQPSADDSDEDLGLCPDDVNGKILHKIVPHFQNTVLIARTIYNRLLMDNEKCSIILFIQWQNNRMYGDHENV